MMDAVQIVLLVAQALVGLWLVWHCGYGCGAEMAFGKWSEHERAQEQKRRDEAARPPERKCRCQDCA